MDRHTIPQMHECRYIGNSGEWLLMASIASLPCFCGHSCITARSLENSVLNGSKISVQDAALLMSLMSCHWCLSCLSLMSVILFHWCPGECQDRCFPWLSFIRTADDKHSFLSLFWTLHFDSLPMKCHLFQYSCKRVCARLFPYLSLFINTRVHDPPLSYIILYIRLHGQQKRTT